MHSSMAFQQPYSGAGLHGVYTKRLQVAGLGVRRPFLSVFTSNRGKRSMEKQH